MWVRSLIKKGVIKEARFPKNKLVGVMTFDGRSIGGRDEVFVGLKFVWIDDLGSCQSHSTIFPVGIYPGKDNVENTKAIFDAKPVSGGRSLREEIDAVKAWAPFDIQVDGQTKSIETQQHCVADQKSMWALLNICQGPMTHANRTTELCSWCHCTNDPGDKGDWGKTRKARTYDLFDPLEELVFCLLHMKLRITEKLFQLTCVEAIKNKSQGKLQQTIRDMDIHMTIKTEAGGNLTITSMNGPDCEKLMFNLDWLAAIGENSGKFHNLWATYVQLFEGLNGRYDSTGPSEGTLKNLRNLQKSFGKQFEDLFLRREITPYIHLLVDHSVDALKTFKALWRYANEGFEASNKRHRYWFGRCTQRGGTCGGSNQHKKRKNRHRKCPRMQVLMKNLRVLHYRVRDLTAIRAREAKEWQDREDRRHETEDESDAESDFDFDCDSDTDDDDESEGVEPNTQESESDDEEETSPCDEKPAEGYSGLICAATYAQQHSLIIPSKTFKVPPGIHRSETNSSHPLKLPPATIERLNKPRMISQDLHDSLARDLNKRYRHVLSVKCDYTLRLLQGEHKHVNRWLSNKEVIDSALPLLTDQAPTTPVTHILFTIHRDLHWVLAVLDLKNKQFTHLNSLNSGEPDDDEAKDELDLLKTHLNLAAGDTSIPWAPDQFPDVPQQVGGVDCGVFTLAWSTCVGLGVDPAEVKQDHMPNLRQRFLLRLLLPAEDTLT
jgi:hypothetical protein